MSINTQDFSPTSTDIQAELDQIEADIELEMDEFNSEERREILAKIRKLHQELTASEEAC